MFLAPRGGGKALRVWGAVFSRFGGDVAGCSYAFCRSCGGGAQACGCRLVTAAAYEPALVFADLRSRGQVLVEDGRWQKTMRFPAPTSRRQALGDLRKAARNWIALRH